jgi:hypothetical protein
VILAPRGFLGEPEQIRAGDMMMVPISPRRIRLRKPSALFVWVGDV